MGQTRFSNERWIYVASMGLSMDEQKAVERFKTEVVEPSMSQLVILDFHAEWCGPCKQIGPSLEELSDEMNGRVKIVKVNVDENPNSPAQVGVRGIPALFIFKDGQVVSNLAGARPKAALQSWIEESI